MNYDFFVSSYLKLVLLLWQIVCAHWQIMILQTSFIARNPVHNLTGLAYKEKSIYKIDFVIKF